MSCQNSTLLIGMVCGSVSSCTGPIYILLFWILVVDLFSCLWPAVDVCDICRSVPTSCHNRLRLYYLSPRIPRSALKSIHLSNCFQSLCSLGSIYKYTHLTQGTSETHTDFTWMSPCLYRRAPVFLISMESISHRAAGWATTDLYTVVSVWLQKQRKNTTQTITTEDANTVQTDCQLRGQKTKSSDGMRPEQWRKHIEKHNHKQVFSRCCVLYHTFVICNCVVNFLKYFFSLF